ncbi:hypothetical protein ES288_D11G265100v1 [Gossypium darwinii]|uniref:DUF659 domain-containing protein n=1 Tax=Gossypium darwinii TaxID=34276 RepID=A0A5D2ATL8_GOSDA|nr:hypothetical protein ES288_D11G265100v1 [Gossypium darwinii]
MTFQSGSGNDISKTPLWRYVTKLPKIVERVCPSVTLTHLAEMQKIVEDAKLMFEIARMFYSGGLPFHLARNPHYVNAVTLTSKNSIPERANIERLLQPIKGMWREKDISLICDGWTDAQRRPLVNFMTIFEGRVVFLKPVNCEKEYKDKFYVTTLIKDAISEVGAQNVVQVITNNALVCKVVGSLVETQHPHIFWTPCVVHTLNLAFKNICAAKNIEKNEVTYDVLCWINNVGNINSFVPLKLLLVADTRFASMIAMLKRFKLIKWGLQNMVTSDEWSTYREDDVSKAYLVDYILTFTEPIYDMLRIMDTDKSTLHLVYEIWDEMIEKVKTSIYRHEGKKGDERLILYEVPNHLLPHKDVEISEEKNKCSRRYFPSIEEKKMIFQENWSTYSFINSMRRNKINPQRAENLVFNKMWDIGGDVFDSFEGVEILGVASLSLDEPDMEMVIFSNEDEDMENANAMN